MLISIFIQCSSKQKQIERKIIISQKLAVKKGIQILLKRVYDDSRCPKNVSCVRAGEVSVELEVYEKNVLNTTKTLTFNAKNKAQNTAWFANYFKGKDIKDVLVLPYPENGKPINPDHYYLKLEY